MWLPNANVALDGRLPADLSKPVPTKAEVIEARQKRQASIKTFRFAFDGQVGKSTPPILEGTTAPTLAADVYLARGDTTLAISAYKRSIRNDSAMREAIDRLETLMRRSN
jgi:hypothetical protein